MITKAVGDWFGSGGIADRYIRLNGYPILDNDEKVFGVPGKNEGGSFISDNNHCFFFSCKCHARKYDSNDSIRNDF